MLTLLALLIVDAGDRASPAGAAPAPVAARVTGVIVEPDGRGARLLVTLRGAFHYFITGERRRVVVVLDPVVARSATHVLAAGPVRSVALQSIAGPPPRARITVRTSEPVEVADSSLDGATLVVRLARAGSCVGRTRPINGAVSRECAASASPSGRLPAAGAHEPASTARIDRSAGVTRTLTLEQGMGRLLDVDRLVRVAVSDPGVLGVVPVSSGQLLITARAAGRTTLYVWERGGRLLAYAVEVRPGVDVFARLRRVLAALLPTSAITVTEVRGAGSAAPAAGRPPASFTAPPIPSPAALPPIADGLNGSASAAPSYAYPAAQGANSAATPAGRSGRAGVVLTGTVETQIDRVKAGEIARAFVAGVVNLLTVRRPVQFGLRVQVLELSRSAQDALGITWGGGQQAPGAAPSLNGGVYNLQLLTSPGVSTSGLDLLIAQLAALSQRGQAKLLARPELTVLAGQTASLLLGGQVPVPVAGPNGSVTIEYKDFGVILAARPDYQDDGRIFLRIAPEVSTLDFTDAVKVNGFTIPALRVRRAQTMVAMRPGETLVLGGLLQRDDTELVQKVPFLADLPVIGALFRSRSFQRQESDLVILVTPQLVRSSHAP